MQLGQIASGKLDPVVYGVDLEVPRDVTSACHVLDVNNMKGDLLNVLPVMMGVNVAYDYTGAFPLVNDSFAA